MKKVLTMTLNPCVDRTVYLESFQVGGTNIVNKVMEEVAGKGINVAVGLKHLQVPVKAMGFAYKEDASRLYQKLEVEQIPHAFVEVDGHLRVNQKLFDESKSEMTECNEKGSPVIKENINSLLALLREELDEASILVLSGSVPPGVDADIYAVMIAMANQAGVKVILDAGGELLRQGVKATPYLIKPNHEEFAKTFLQDDEAIDYASMERHKLNASMSQEILNNKARELILGGVSYICLSLGADGAMMFGGAKVEEGALPKETELLKEGMLPKEGMLLKEGEVPKEGMLLKEGKLLIEAKQPKEAETIEVTHRPAIKVPVRSLQGAGDAMVAGLCKAIYDNQEEKMLDYALNMAASTIMLEGTAMGDSVKASKNSEM